MKKPKHIESRLQQACVKWFRIQHRNYGSLLFAVPNGGARSGAEASILIGEGVVSGVSDLILLVGRKGFNALCIEMKRPGGKQTELQKAWQAEAEAGGSKYQVVDTLEGFIELVNWYLS